MYALFNITLDSQIPVPELSRGSALSDADIYTFSLSESIAVPNTNIDWFHDWHDPNGDISVSAGRVGDEYWLRFPGMVDFGIDLKQRAITAYKQPDTPLTTVRHLLLDQVIPRMLGQQGHLILHAGAVVTASGKTVAFIGQSGWGKSTLVSSFQQQGAQLITDDCMMIDVSHGSASAIPNYHGIRLFDDSIDAIYGERQLAGDVAHYSSKRRLILSDSRQSGERQMTEPLQFDALFLLNDPTGARFADQINVTVVGGIDAMMTLVAQTFVLDVTDKSLMALQFRHCGKLLESKLLCFRLDYPRDHHRLADVRKVIEGKIKD